MGWISAISQQLERYGLNQAERAIVYGSTLIGAVAPLALARYVLFPNPNGQASGEVLSWAASVALNLLPIVFEPHMPIPFYTGMAGTASGMVAASGIARRRQAKERQELETLLRAEPIGSKKEK